MYLPVFFVRQKFAPTVNRYQIRAVGPDGGAGEVIAAAQQKRLALKERVTFYADEQRTQPVFSFKARKVVDLNAGYDVFDERGDAIGYFRKDFTSSLVRSTFELNGPYGLDAAGQERNPRLALIRRVLRLPFALEFDWVQDGRPVLHVQRAFTLLDHYTVQVIDPRIDFRLAAAMTVALSTLTRN